MLFLGRLEVRRAGKILDTGFWPLDAGRERKARNAGNVRKGKGKYGARVVVGEVAEDLFNHGLCLPSGTPMTEDDLDRVISVIRRCHK